METWGPSLMNLGYYRLCGALSFLNVFCNLECAQRRLVMKSVDLLHVAPGEQVLDVACGRGKSSFIIRCMQPAATVVGIDLLESNVQVARTLFNKVEGLSYLPGNAMDLEFAEESFDRVLCVEAAFHFPDKRRFLQEAYRVLRPGGRMVVVDFSWKTDADHVHRFDPETQLVKEIWQWDDMFSVPQYTRTATELGFRVVESQDWSSRVTGPMQGLFEFITSICNNPWGRNFMMWRNPLYRSFTKEDWQSAAIAVQAHQHLHKHTRYMAYVLEK
jgi:SAM-dependent methyltransferase